ncbi:LytR C-terminal domain-containing protein [Cellulomonas composti]|uniref:LytR/CpsA/Psr regulator C-terminal domain-containing protein n=1 Tax=Cellulomonas composti TaxID=266130 RepID=A0A511JDK5_9CELL|nr:LytR C-terminal domain-containing protein [Cellulomonas composti]GEL95869.1 hypothetical protein CCO02nite_25270 [Cellulomonas composti]
MSKADYPYPDDEFDAAADPSAPRGVHRSPRSAWSRWWPFLAVLVLAPLLAYSLVTYMSRDTGSSGDDDVTTSSATPTPGSSATAAPTDGATEPTGEATQAESPTPTAEPTIAPVMSTPVAVLNGAGIQGLAGQGAEKLTDAGFTSVTSDNFSGTKPASSTVYYASDDLRSTADLVAATLGLTTVTLDAGQAGDGITVVLVSALP